MQVAQFQTLINSINDNGRNTALEVRTVLSAIRDELFPIGEIKLMSVSLTDFDSTGLGTGIRSGFAICNGFNNTVDYRRKVPVGYDSTLFVSGFNYSVLGGSFGSEDHTLIENELPIIDINGHTQATGVTAGGGSGAQPWAGGITDTIGGGLAHNNMQPSKVTLFIQRIS